MDELARHEVLWTKAVDGVLTPAEQAEWAAWQAAHPDAAAALALDLGIKAHTDAMADRIRQSAGLAPPRLTGGAALTAGLGFALLAAGTTALLGFAGWTVLTDATLPAWVRGAAVATAAGATLLFGLTLRQRLAAPDPYREIDR